MSLYVPDPAPLEVEKTPPFSPPPAAERIRAMTLEEYVKHREKLLPIAMASTKDHYLAKREFRDSTKVV